LFFIFDIDGTLTATNEFDAHCSARAFERCFGVGLPTTDWHFYRTSTDSGIVSEALEIRRGSPATASDLDQFESAFLEELEQASKRDPQAIHEIPGARALLGSLDRSSAHDYGIATGGMKSTSLYKLATAQIDLKGKRASFANDDFERAGIIRNVLKMANVPPADAIYVGDAAWDAAAAAELGMRFIGMVHDSSREELATLGIRALLSDYSNPEKFFEAARLSESPRLGTKRDSPP